MRSVLALARLALTVCAGYGLVWAFSSPTPAWTQRPLTRPPIIDLTSLSFPGSDSSTASRAQAAAPAESLQGAAGASPGDGRAAPPFEGLTLPDAALELARRAQPLRLEPAPTDDGAWVIGYGRAVDERPARAVSAEEAEQMLREDLARAAETVRETVTVPLNANELGALAEFARSIGVEELPNTIVVVLLNAGDRAAAADALMLWTTTREDGALVESEALVAQRQRTRALFLADAGASGA